MNTQTSGQASGEDDAERPDTRRWRSSYTRIESFVPGKPVAAAPPVARRAEWAIIVNHGMGQQVHFETLEEVVVALRDAEYRARGTAHPVHTRIVKLPAPPGGSDLEILRAEMEVTDAHGRTHSVDVYESYWAPLTEGKVTLPDCTKFLLEGATRGILYLIRYGARFDRWVFGGMKEFPVHELLTAFRLAIGLLVFFGPILLATVVTVGQMGGMLLALISPQAAIVAHEGTIALALREFIPDIAWFELCLLVFAFGAGILPKLYRAKFFAGRIGLLGVLRVFLHILAVSISLAGMLALFFVECQFVLHAWRFFTRNITAPAYPPGRIGLVWVGALAAALVARWFLIEYMGDVAAYLSAHKLSKFDELRDRIKKSVLDVMAAVYRCRVDGQNTFFYNKIMVVGHSLGSVISYDVLNLLLVEDEVADEKAAASGKKADSLRVQERTKLLLTFGSPLDKAAFLFRTKGGTDELREAAAANWQPLIRDYAFRPDSWVNIYSWMDIISGNLHFYDDPENPAHGAGRRIDNQCDYEALLPLAAHIEYWINRKFGDTMYERIA